MYEYKSVALILTLTFCIIVYYICLGSLSILFSIYILI